MRTSVAAFVSLFACSLACSSSSSSAVAGGSGAPDAGADTSAPVGSVVEHGTIVDYFSLKPIAGLTVADNGVSTKTGTDGKWSLTVPTNAKLQPTVSGGTYTQLYFPDSVPSTAAADVDFGTSVMPDTSTYKLEQDSLDGFDTSKALVQIVLITTGNCKDVTGGTATVKSPANARLTYFSEAGIPAAAETMFEMVRPNRPVVVVYNIDVGSELAVQIDHPTCKQVPFPATYAGKTYSGKVRTAAAEPGDTNAALVILME